MLFLIYVIQKKPYMIDLSYILDRFGDAFLLYELVLFDRAEIFLSMTLILLCRFCLFDALSLMNSLVER